MRFQLIPDKQGQICRFIETDKGGDNVYIIVGEIDNNPTTLFVKLTDLQRNTATPEQARKQNMAVSDFTVIADSLEKYVDSWNGPIPPDELKAYIISDVDDVR